MTDNEKLIAEAERVVMDLDEAHGEVTYRELVAAALTVFEKAHTPTDDERDLIDTANQMRKVATGIEPGSLIGLWLRTAAALEARIRRSEVPEPGALPMSLTDDPIRAPFQKKRPQGEPSEHRDRIALAEFIDKALDGDAGYGVGAFLAGGILSFLSNRAELHVAFAQGEPSDALDLDSLEHIVRTSVLNNPDWVRPKMLALIAALRAAGEVHDV